MTSVLLVPNDFVGSRMAGPGIRYHQFASALARRFDVTLLIRNDPVDVQLPAVRIVQAPGSSYARVKELSRESDVVIAQGGLGVRTMRYLARAGVRTIYDMYVPFSETLAYEAAQGRAASYGTLSSRAQLVRQELALATGDAFLCANDRQRRLLLGALSVLGRLGMNRYRQDPTLRNLVTVVPYGLPAIPGTSAGAVLKGVVPGIRTEDRVLLWGGGLWDWLDPLTVIRAIERIASVRDDVKLYFLGVRHPNAAARAMGMNRRAVELAERLGLTGKYVFFNLGWIPYDERASYLLEADLGVSAHFDSIETRFAHRTRLLDYFWAGLPTVTSRGDVLAELVEREHLGRTVAPEDAEGFAAAVLTLLDDETEYRAIRANLEAIRPRLAWNSLVEPLAELVDGGTSPPPPKNMLKLPAAYAALRLRIALQDRRRPSERDRESGRSL